MLSSPLLLSSLLSSPLSSRSEEHTSELQSHLNLVCRLLLEKKDTRVTRGPRGPARAAPVCAARRAVVRYATRLATAECPIWSFLVVLPSRVSFFLCGRAAHGFLPSSPPSPPPD